MNQPPAEFLSAASSLGIEFEPGDVERMSQFLDLLYAANETTNLTAVRDPVAAWTRHILDSLTLLPILAELPADSTVIDVGTGAGLPGIPLAITLPALRFTLLEATGKKAAFLRDTVARLGLKNVRVICDRAERLAHERGEKTAKGRVGGHREAYDAVVARAVGRLPTLAELTVPLAKAPAAGTPGGIILLIKGEQAAAEVAEAAHALHLLKAVHDQTLPMPTGNVVVLHKGAATPKDYPRRDGEPSRSPLMAPADKKLK